jgi:hypothetical protein
VRIKVRDILGRREDARTEFKGPEALKSPEPLLSSVVAFLNTDGGVLYVGVEETAALATAAPGVENPDREAGRLMDLIADLIEPRPGIPPPDRLPSGRDRAVLALKVPRGPARERPYALRQGASYRFYGRFGDRNRPLDMLQVRGILRGGAAEDDLSRQRREFSKQRERFATTEATAALRLVIHPASGLPLDLKDRNLMRAMGDVRVAGNRLSGWTYEAGGEPRRRQGRLEKGDAGPPAYRHLVIHETGRIEFTTERDEEWSWHTEALERQGTSTIDPFVVTEYPASVLRLAAHIFRAGKGDGTVLVDFGLRGIEGTLLPAGIPGTRLFRDLARFQKQRYTEGDLFVKPAGPLEVEAQELIENPDRVAFRIARDVYGAYSLDEEEIPFYNRSTGRFEFAR